MREGNRLRTSPIVLLASLTTSRLLAAPPLTVTGAANVSRVPSGEVTTIRSAPGPGRDLAGTVGRQEADEVVAGSGIDRGEGVGRRPADRNVVVTRAGQQSDSAAEGAARGPVVDRERHHRALDLRAGQGDDVVE